MANTATKMVTLKSSDGEEFVVSEAVAMQFETIRHIIEDDCGNNSIPLPSVDSKILVKVIEYCTKHAVMPEKAAHAPKAEKATPNMLLQAKELNWRDVEFLNCVNIDTYDDHMRAADYLNIHDLPKMKKRNSS